jgi:hypothetical protein
VYYPTKNYSNKFLHLVNLGVKNMDTIDWYALARLASTATKGDRNRQRQYEDFGTTAGQCTLRVGSSVGVLEPRRKPGTTDPSIVQAMLVLCAYTQNAKYNWMPDGVRPFNCDDKNDERNQFGHRFHPDCFIPAS